MAKSQKKRSHYQKEIREPIPQDGGYGN